MTILVRLAPLLSREWRSQTSFSERLSNAIVRRSRNHPQTASMPTMMWRRLGLALSILYFLAGGIAHFEFAAAETGIIPPWVPYPSEVNYLTGVLELLGAIGLMIPMSRRVAGAGLILLTICVTPANAFMLEHAERFPGIPQWLLVARLALQVLLVLLIAWSSGISMKRSAPHQT